MVLIEQIICEEIERLLNEKKWKRKKRASAPDPNTYKRKVSSKTALSKRIEDAKREAERKREAAAERAKNRNNTNKSGNIARPKRPSSDSTNDDQQSSQTQTQTQQPQAQPQSQQPQSQQSQEGNNLPPKPTQEGGDMCHSKDFVGICINKIKKKISDLYVGWPKSLFSMNEDNKGKEGSRDVESGDANEEINTILSDFEKEFKKTTTIGNIRRMFAKLFELWTITNTDRAQDYNDKCNALKKNLKNYRKIFTTYRSKFTNAFKTLDINKSQLQREYRLIEEDIAYWEERMDKYSPKIQEILRDHISILESNKSTYKSRMFWYFKAPKFMRRKTKATKKVSDNKWDKRKAAYKRFRQKGRQAVKNYFNRGPKAGSSPSSEKK